MSFCRDLRCRFRADFDVPGVLAVPGDPSAGIVVTDFFFVVPILLLLIAIEIGASTDFFKRILMPIVFSLNWLWYIATSALRFGRPLEVFVAVVTFDRPTDFLLDSIAIANDLGFPPDGDFLTTEVGDTDD